MSTSIVPVQPVIPSDRLRQKFEGIGLTLKNNVMVDRNLRFRNPAYVASNCIVMRTQIDAYSYMERFSVASNTTIGRYCSIGHYVDMAMGIHNYERFTTSPAFYKNMIFMDHSGEIAEEDPDFIARGMNNEVTIGNDVWIGAYVNIPASVTIGHGAVISTNAVITKDVPPYAIVVGGPDNNGRGSQHILKYRFPDEIISDLLEIKWWDYDLPRMIAQGIKVPRDNIADLISFIKNEDRDKLLPLSDQWRLCSFVSADRAFIFPSRPDTFMDYNAVEVDNQTGAGVRLLNTRTDNH